MVILLVAGVGVVYWAEAAGNPLLTAIGVDPSPGNMEGKEVRFGLAMTRALRRRRPPACPRRRQRHA